MDSKVSLSTKCSGKKTVNRDVYFTPPYKIIAPIYTGDEAEIFLLSSSAGLLKGDTIDMDFRFEENSKVKISSQSYEKVFDTQDGCVTRNLSIDVLDKARVKFMPYPTIPFKNSSYTSTCEVNLAEDCKFCYLDIFSCGRVHSDERFKMRSFHNYLSVNVAKKPVFIDNTLIDPVRWDYNSIGMWHGFSHNGFMYVYSKNSEQDIINLALELGTQKLEGYEFGASRCRAGVCIRVLGNSGDKIFKYFEEIAKTL